MMRNIAVLLFCLIITAQAGAQQTAMPAWITKSFHTEVVSPDREHGTPRTSYRNTFIGSYTLRLTIHHDGISQILWISAWQDSTRGVVRVEMVPGLPHTTYFADLATNTAVIANIIDRKATVGPLNTVLFIDRIGNKSSTAQWQIPASEPDRDTLIAGQRCSLLQLHEDGSVINIWKADIDPSPFVDAPAWIPFNEGPLKAFRLLFGLGDIVALKLSMAPMLDLEVMDLRIGSTPPPVVDLSSYELDLETMERTPHGTPEPQRERMEH